MLSSEHPSDPSCSSKSVAWGVGAADPATSRATSSTPSPAHQESPDFVQPRTSFSIRDYAFDSRSKGIKRNWPFHPQSLELCLKHGVKDLLPPFEPPSLLRSRSFYTCKNFEESAACSEADTFVGLVETREAVSSNVNTSGINLQSQLANESLGPSQYTPPGELKTATDRGGNTNEPGHSNEVIQAWQEDNICTKAIRRTEVARPSCRIKNLGSSQETSEEKGKLLVKSVSVKNIHQTKDVSSNSSSVLDPNASKTCPVCKVFSSTSNTTLNAHIDQCLYAVSNTELVAETVILKPKVKQMKKQLMVEIYKTALPYTLEDLDRRNGTNWAIELSEPTMKKGVRSKYRNPKVVPSESRDGERDRDVYVDSNGIKIRILSKPIDAPLVLKDELSLKKVTKHESGKSISMTKTFLEPKSFRTKKFKVHGKKCNRLNHLKSQVADIHYDTSEEEPSMHTRKPTESTSCGGSETTRRWVCSKRSDITKNFGTKLDNTPSDSRKPRTKKLAKSCILGFDSPQVTESYSDSLSSRSTEEIASASEVNDDAHGNGCSGLLGSIAKWSSENSSSTFPKVPRSAATLAKRKIKEIGRREASKSYKYGTVRRISTMAKGSEACLSVSITGLSNEPKRTASTPKVLKKHRSLSRNRKREFSPSLGGLVHGFGQEHELDFRHVKNNLSVSNNGTSKKVAKHTQEDTTDNDVSCGTDVPTLGQGDHQYDVEQQTESTHMDYEGEEHATQVQHTSVCRNSHEDCCSAISTGSLSPENSKIADGVLAKGSFSMEDPCSTEQSTHASNIVAINETEEQKIDPASTKEPGACFTNNRGMGLATPHDTSTITSNREDSTQDHVFLAFGRDSSNSPISIASTMSSPIALKDSRIEESGPGPSSINVRTVEDSMSGSSNQEMKSTPPAREGEHVPNEKLYCCSCRESISKEPHLDHESSTAGSDTFTRKQVPQLQMGLRTSSSFSTYQRTDTKANPLDSHGQPLDRALVGNVSTESSMNFQSYTADYVRPSVQSQLPSPTSPMLRLMGKNLMVMNSQEREHLEAPSSDYMLGGNYMAPAGYVPPNYQHSDSAFMNRTPPISSQQITLPSVQAGHFVGPPMHGGFMVQPHHHALQKPYTNLAPAMHHPNYMMKEVIMIYDDSPGWRSEPQVGALHPTGTYPTPVSFPNTSAPTPFYCHPSPVPILPRDSFAGAMPFFRNSSPMVGVNTFGQRNQVRYSQPLHATPSHVQSPQGYMNPPVYYPQDFR